MGDSFIRRWLPVLQFDFGLGDRQEGTAVVTFDDMVDLQGWGQFLSFWGVPVVHVASPEFHCPSATWVAAPRILHACLTAAGICLAAIARATPDHAVVPQGGACR